MNKSLSLSVCLQEMSEKQQGSPAKTKPGTLFLGH